MLPFATKFASHPWGLRVVDHASDARVRGYVAIVDKGMWTTKEAVRMLVGSDIDSMHFSYLTAPSFLDCWIGEIDCNALMVKKGFRLEFQVNMSTIGFLTPSLSPTCACTSMLLVGFKASFLPCFSCF